MISMARTPADKKDIAEGAKPVTIDDVIPDYPFGLCISLSEEEISKLGLENCQVGEEIECEFRAKVTSKSESEREGGEKCSRVELQITHLEKEDEEEETRKPPASRRRRYDGSSHYDTPQKRDGL